VVVDSQGYMGVGTTVPAQPFHLVTGNSNVVIDSRGNVGIGTITPQFPLQVQGSILVGSILEKTHINSTNIGFNRNTSTGAIFDSSAHAYQFQHIQNSVSTQDTLNLQTFLPNGSATNGTAWVVNGHGNIGIGTDRPLTPLHVNGNSLVKGIYANIVRLTGQTLNSGWTSISWETSSYNITNGISITGGSPNITFNFSGVYMVTLNFRFGVGGDVWTGCALRSGGTNYGTSHGTGNIGPGDPGSICFNFLANITNTALSYQLDIYRNGASLAVDTAGVGFPTFVCTMVRIG
jgi:hypothetical protein